MLKNSDFRESFLTRIFHWIFVKYPIYSTVYCYFWRAERERRVWKDTYIQSFLKKLQNQEIYEKSNGFFQSALSIAPRDLTRVALCSLFCSPRPPAGGGKWGPRPGRCRSPPYCPKATSMVPDERYFRFGVVLRTHGLRELWARKIQAFWPPSVFSCF